MTMHLVENHGFCETAVKNLFVEYSTAEITEFMLYVLENADRENEWIDLYWY